MHGPWHPILHNSPRPLKQRETLSTGPQYVSVIPNDYSWYRPLDRTRKEIRILYLEPEPLDSPKDVIIYVFNASLDDPKVVRLYGCLSYCWGDTKVTKAVQVMYSEKSDSASNGLVTTQTRFQVTSNLEAALRVLRSKLKRPVLWADALCIDQSDLDERSSQVPLMSEIYSQAVQTVIWLGEADSTTKMVFDFADFMTEMEIRPHEIDPKTTAAGIVCGRVRPLAKGQLQFLEHEVASDDFYKIRWGIQAILARPFFRRVWVLQEIGLADPNEIVIHCGPPSLWWKTFLNLISFEWRAASHQGPLPIDPRRDLRLGLPTQNPAMKPGSHYRLPEIWTYLNMYCSTTKRGKILDLVFRRHEIQATDPRDHVFALLGLAEECEDKSNIHLGFCADYTRNVAEVFTLFTRAVIDKLQNVIVLSDLDVFEQSKTRQERGLPSWVPEYDRNFNLRRAFGFLGEGHYRASGETRPHITHSDPNELVLTGIIIDVVNREPEWGPYPMIVETENEHNPGKATKLLVNGDQGGIRLLWKIVSMRIQQNSIVGQDLLETFILTLICCRREHYNRELISAVTDLPDLLADFAAYWNMHFGDFSDLPQQTTLYESHEQLRRLAMTGNAGSFGQRLFYTCNERSFLVTNRGLLALVPRRTTHGDFIVVFEGANVPHVIRKMNAEDVRSSIKSLEPRCEFIGECYVHGRMDGSTMAELEMGYFMANRLHLC